jgi:aldehyde dehydrogenase (NAD+)
MTSPIACGHLIAGRWETSGGRQITRANPGDTSEVVARAPEGGAEDARRAVEGATRAAANWRKVIPPERGKVVLRAARILEDRLEEVAALLTREQGKLLSESRAEVKRAVDIMEYAAGLGRRLGGRPCRPRCPGSSATPCASRSGPSPCSRPGTSPSPYPAGRSLPLSSVATASCSSPLR